MRALQETFRTFSLPCLAIRTAKRKHRISRLLTAAIFLTAHLR
jgi:hypothetical protein